MAEAVDAARRLAPRFAARAGDTTGRARSRSDDFADLRDGRPLRADGAGRGWAARARASPTTRAVAYELARGNGATALVFNMHASVTGALGAVTDELAEALGVPDEALAARDRLLAGGRRGLLVRGGDERARRRLAAVPADHQLRAGRRRLPHQGREDVLLRRRARRRATWSPPAAPPTSRWSPSSWCRPVDGLRSSRPGTRWACGRPARTTCTST